jgi:hypothetical protein
MSLADIPDQSVQRSTSDEQHKLNRLHDHHSRKVNLAASLMHPTVMQLTDDLNFKLLTQEKS